MDPRRLSTPEPEEIRERPRREHRQRITGTQIVFVAILAIGLLLTINFSARITRGRAYSDLKQQVEGTISALEAENLDLRQELDYVQSDAAVEQWAHRDAKMTRNGEVLVIPIPGFVLPSPTPRPTPRPVNESTETADVPPADLWWSLFFDSKPPW